MEARRLQRQPTELIDFANPLNHRQTTFNGKKLKITKEAAKTISSFGGVNKLKLRNQIDYLITDITKYKLHSSQNIYLDFGNTYFKVSVSSHKAPYIATIETVELIKKPQPLRPRENTEANFQSCSARASRGIAREIVQSRYSSEKIIKNNVFTAEDLVNIQTLRMKEHVRTWRAAKHTASQWCDVCYGGNEVIGLSAMFPITEQTKTLTKTAFGYLGMSGLGEVLHRYAMIFGHPYTWVNSKRINISQALSGELYGADKNKLVNDICSNNQFYSSDLIIHIDSELNIHQFYKNGHYQLIEC